MKDSKLKKYSTEWYDEFPFDDTRHYGLFLEGKHTENQTLSVDMNRFCEYFHIDDSRKNLKTNKNSKRFKPAKSKIDDYRVNIIKRDLSQIEKDWKDSQKIFIDQFLSEVKGHDFTVGEDDNFLMGIADFDEAATFARVRSVYSHQYADFKRNRLFYSLYAQYFHQLAAQIDAVTLRLLTKNGYENDHFDRSSFLAFKGPKEESFIKKLDSYRHHENMYAIWNFIKHNSGSTYAKVLELCPEVLEDHEYEQGELACFYIRFSKELIEQTIDGVRNFLIEYCQIVFDEDEKEAEWNHNEFFQSYVYDAINEYFNPLGLPDY